MPSPEGKARFAVVKSAALALGLPVRRRVAALTAAAERAAMHVRVAARAGAAQPLKGLQARAGGVDAHGPVRLRLASGLVTRLAGDLLVFVGQLEGEQPVQSQPGGVACLPPRALCVARLARFAAAVIRQGIWIDRMKPFSP